MWIRQVVVWKKNTILPNKGSNQGAAEKQYLDVSRLHFGFHFWCSTWNEKRRNSQKMTRKGDFRVFFVVFRLG